MFALRLLNRAYTTWDICVPFRTERASVCPVSTVLSATDAVRSALTEQTVRTSVRAPMGSTAMRPPGSAGRSADPATPATTAISVSDRVSYRN